MDERERSRILERIRELRLALPETSERPGHGAPTFFVRGDGRFAIRCAAPGAIQGLLVARSGS